MRKRYEISHRSRTNKKKDSAEECRAAIQSFHRTLRRALKTKRQRDSSALIDAKWGRCLPSQKYNVDQVPLPFVVNQSKTYAGKGSKQVWVSQPMSGLEKRQATLQLCIRGNGPQTVKLATVFGGKGNVTLCELAKLDKRIDVYFQEKE